MSFNDVTFIIPVKFECKERKINLDIVKNRLLQLEPAYIDIYETKDKPFHRTKYLNKMIKRAKTPIVGVWDTDVVLHTTQIEQALANIRNGATISYPHSGEFLDVPDNLKEYEPHVLDVYKGGLESLSQDSDSVGGAFFIHKQRYTECGLENENCISWGCEDRERYSRVEKLGRIIMKVQGTIYHLHHPRTEDSWASNPHFNDNLAECRKVQAMNKETLLKYITTWKWVK